MAIVVKNAAQGSRTALVISHAHAICMNEYIGPTERSSSAVMRR